MYKARMKIGSMTLEMEASDMKDVFKWSGVFGNLPKLCDACGQPNLYLSHRSPQNFDYYSLACSDCGAEATFGQNKEGGGLFWKWDNKMEKYVPPESGEITSEDYK